MKPFNFLTIILSLFLALGASAQCPDSVSCDTSQFTFHYTAAPTCDSITVNVGGNLVGLSVDSTTSTAIYTNKGSLDCSDAYTQIKYFSGGSITGSICNTNGLLPVDLIFFDVTRINSSNVLTWTTASEINNSHFVIETLYEGNEWVQIGYIPGNGTTQVINHYIYTDNVTQSHPISYYRLKQIDFDQKFEYSDVVYIKGLSDSEPVYIILIDDTGRIMPNDAVGNNITTIKVFNNGQAIKSRTSPY